MNYCKIFLKPKKEESLLRFHPWVFSGAIQSIEGNPEEGDLIRYAALPYVSYRSNRLRSMRIFG